MPSKIHLLRLHITYDFYTISGISTRNRGQCDRNFAPIERWCASDPSVTRYTANRPAASCPSNAQTCSGVSHLLKIRNYTFRAAWKTVGVVFVLIFLRFPAANLRIERGQPAGAPADNCGICFAGASRVFRGILACRPRVFRGVGVFLLRYFVGR